MGPGPTASGARRLELIACTAWVVSARGAAPSGSRGGATAATRPRPPGRRGHTGAHGAGPARHDGGAVAVPVPHRGQGADEVFGRAASVMGALGVCRARDASGVQVVRMRSQACRGGPARRCLGVEAGIPTAGAGGEGAGAGLPRFCGGLRVVRGVVCVGRLIPRRYGVGPQVREDRPRVGHLQLHDDLRLSDAGPQRRRVVATLGCRGLAFRAWRIARQIQIGLVVSPSFSPKRQPPPVDFRRRRDAMWLDGDRGVLPGAC
jgi:hypothetical protein